MIWLISNFYILWRSAW